MSFGSGGAKYRTFKCYEEGMERPDEDLGCGEHPFKGACKKCRDKLLEMMDNGKQTDIKKE